MRKKKIHKIGGHNEGKVSNYHYNLSLCRWKFSVLFSKERREILAFIFVKGKFVRQGGVLMWKGNSNS